MAGALVEDRTDDERATIEAESQSIVKNGWKPKHFMIDKSLAEKRAIQEGKCLASQLLLLVFH
jgi:hypothetical protein